MKNRSLLFNTKMLDIITGCKLQTPNKSMKFQCFKKWNLIILFLLLISFSSSLLAVDLVVNGITKTGYTDANGTYKPQGTLARSGITYWKHESKEYYIYYDAYDAYNNYWNLDNNTNDDDVVIAYSIENPSAASPVGLTMYDGTLLDGTAFNMTVAEYSAAPEINITGNGIPINSGATTPAYTDYTNFGTAITGGGTATRTFTIQNTGAQALSIGAISFSGTNYSDFSVTTSPASSVVASGSTTFTVTFTPSAIGNRTATISIGNNDSNENPYTFAISGYGFTAKNLVVSGSTTPSDAIGTYVYAGIKNNFPYWKHSTLDYYLVNYPDATGAIRTWALDNNFLTTDGYPFYCYSTANVPTGLTWSTLSFLPTGASSYSNGVGTLLVADVASVPEINVKVGSFDITNGYAGINFYHNTNFGTLNIASGTKSKSFTIENTGTGTLTLSGTSPYITLTGTNASDFTVTSIPSNSITAGGTTTFAITFDPSTVGTKTAVVNISNNDGDEGSYSFNIQGEAITNKSIMVSNITTPAAANGTYTYQGISNDFEYWKNSSGYYVYNYRMSNADDSYDPIWYIDADMSIDPLVQTTYNFKSTNNGSNASPANVSAWSASSGSTGTPTILFTEPEINIIGNSLNIASGDNTPSLYDYTDLGWVVSGSISKTFTIQNTGIATLNLTGLSPYITLSGADASQFSITTIPSATIAAGGSTTFGVRFTPSSGTLGARSATLSIANDDSNENPYTFVVQSGVGTLPTVTTQAITNIGSSNAVGNGNITSLGSPNPTSYGICYGTTANPDVTGSKVDKGSPLATGAFTTQITGLTAGTTYHARVFATNNVGTSYGSDVIFTTTSAMTEPGNALAFDGTDDYVSVPFATNSMSAFTIETWINPATIPASGDIAILSTNAWDATNGGIHFQFENGYVELAVYELGSGWPAMSTKLATNTWQHIAVTYDVSNNLVCFYLNGVLNNSISKTLSATKISAAEIGAWNSSRYFNGKLDEFRVWNTVRSQAQIQADMDNNISASTSGLIGYYSFNEGTAGGTNTAGSSILPDLTTNANNGTLNNFARTGTTSNWVESYAMVVPISTTATSTTTSGFTANWTAPVTGTVNNYLLDVATDAAFTSLISGYNSKTVASTSTSSSVTGLSPNVTYYYRVRADKTSMTGEGAYSNNITVETLPVSPTVTTQAVSSILVTTATGNGNITGLGVPNPTLTGICWNTSTSPTTSNFKTTDGPTGVTGTYTGAMTSLTAGQTYYVRAYATNTAGTSYGSEVTFKTLTPGTFTGTDSDWGTASNWASNSVPTPATDVTIPSGKIVVISATTTASCNNLTVTGSLTIQSSASGIGSLIVSGTSTGSVTCQRYMTNGKWHLISPVASSQTVAAFLTANTNIPTSGSTRGMMDYNTLGNSWNSYYPTTSASGTMDAGKGYSSRIATTDGTISFTGTLTTGTKTVALTTTGQGWNCIGNPYTSAIGMNSSAVSTENFITKNSSNLDASYACVYVWDEDATYTGQNCYKVISNSGFSTTKTILAQNYVAPGQGFFVKAKTGASNISFTSAMQSQQVGTPFRAPAVKTSWPGIALSVASTDASSSAIITFNRNMTNGLDPTYDAGLLRGTNGLSLYTRLLEDNGVDFAIQCLPESYDNLVIPVGVDCKDGGEITFSAEIVNLPAACHVILEDRATNTFTSLADGATYNTTVQAGSTAVGRFYIHTGDNTTTGISGLTAEIFSLKAYAVKGSIIIEGEVSDQAIATLYDLQGLKVLAHSLQKGSLNTLSCPNLMNGIYLLTIQQNGETVTKKLILK